MSTSKHWHLQWHRLFLQMYGTHHHHLCLWPSETLYNVVRQQNALQCIVTLTVLLLTQSFHLYLLTLTQIHTHSHTVHTHTHHINTHTYTHTHTHKHPWHQHTHTTDLPQTHTHTPQTHTHTTNMNTPHPKAPTGTAWHRSLVTVMIFQFLLPFCVQQKCVAAGRQFPRSSCWDAALAPWCSAPTYCPPPPPPILTPPPLLKTATPATPRKWWKMKNLS